MAVPSVDFLPAEYHARRRRKRVLATRGGVTLLLLVGMVIASLTAAGREESLDRELTEMMKGFDAQRAKIGQVAELDRKKDELARRLSVLSDVLRRTRGALVLEAVAQSTPPNTSLLKVEFRRRENTAAPETEITIEGRCTDNVDIANFIQALGNQPLLHEVDLKLSEDEDVSQTTKKFVITVKAPGLITLDEPPASAESGK